MFEKKTIGGIFLVAGTSVGAASLALPIVGSNLGLYGSILAFFISWLVMYKAGMLVLEVSLSCKENTSFVSMAEATLGPRYNLPVGVLYIVLLYSLLSAYFSGGIDMLNLYLTGLNSLIVIPIWFEAMLIAIATAIILFLGAKYVDYCNRFMVTGLIISFCILVAMLLFKADLQFNLATIEIVSPKKFLNFLPIVVTAFGFQVVVPSLRSYMKNESNRLPIVILLGSILPFIIYLLWSITIAATITDGDNPLFNSIKPAVDLPLYLNTLLHSTVINYAINAFIFFALVSSILGIGLSLFDFIADRVTIFHGFFNKLLVLFLVILPPLVFELIYPNGFMLALNYAGIFVAVLNGLLPVVMSYKLRKKRGIRYYNCVDLLLVTFISLLILIGSFY